MKTKENKKIEYKGESARQTFHLGVGMIAIFLSYIFQKNILAAVLFIIFLTGLIISITSKKKDMAFVTFMLKLFDRAEDTRFLPGKGALTLTLGCFLAFFMFHINIARASIIILTLGDSLSTIIGKRWGKRKAPFHKSKTWLGLISGIIIAWVGSSFFVPLHIALVGSVVGMTSELLETKMLDDNILISVTSGIIMTLILL